MLNCKPVLGKAGGLIYIADLHRGLMLVETGNKRGRAEKRTHSLISLSQKKVEGLFSAENQTECHWTEEQLCVVVLN